jgi:hypothetical protein
MIRAAVSAAAALTALCLAGILAGLTGCAGDNAVGPALPGLAGSWTWVSSTGGFGGDTRTPVTAGYGARIEFRADGRFEEHRNDSLTRTTTYVVVREPTIFHAEPTDVIRFGDAGMAQEAGIAPGDTLLLADLCNDCYFHVYTRND